MTEADKSKLNFLKLIIPGVLNIGVPVFFCLCILTMAAFGLGSGLNDSVLFLLVGLLRYEAGILIFLALCALAYDIWRLIRLRLIRLVFYMAAHFLCVIFGLVLIFLCSVITVVSG